MNNLLDEIVYLKRTFHLMFVKPVLLELVPIENFSTSISFNPLKNVFTNELAQLGFKHKQVDFFHPDINKIEFWQKRNMNINRSVVLMEINQQIDLDSLVRFVHSIKISLGKATGYFPFFNEVGMQVVVICNGITTAADTIKPVDTFSNQQAIIQSLFIIDNRNEHYFKAVSVMQSVTATTQNRINYIILKKLCPDWFKSEE